MNGDEKVIFGLMVKQQHCATQWRVRVWERKIFGWIRDQERYRARTLFVRRSCSETIRGNEDKRKSSLNTRSLRFQRASRNKRAAEHRNTGMSWYSAHNRALRASVERQCSPCQRLFKYIPERNRTSGRATKSQPNWISEWDEAKV